MPVKRTLHMDDAKHHPPSKIPVPARNQAPLIGTASSTAGKKKATTHEQEVPRTEMEKLDSLRSKLEQSVDAFIKARKELGEIFSAEGSNEQGRLLAGSSADLRTELERHRELSAQINRTLSHRESSSTENKEPKRHGQGPVKMGSSYEFLKSIMG